MTGVEQLELQVVTLSQQGWGQRRIAQELGLSRKAVRTILGRVQARREKGHTLLPAAPVRRASQLDAFVPQMLALLERHPDITAVRMREELTSLGYRGGASILRERMRQLRPRPKAPFVERFETAPGEQGQQDWSPYTVDFTACGKRKVHCFSLVLGYSRRQYIGFTEREDLLTFERQHIRAFERFKGAPREILYDNQKVVALRREAHRPVYNPRFLAFAIHDGFVPRVLMPGKPEHKGKVERPFQYVEGHCLNARTLRDPAELDELALRWMDETSDAHLHDTTRERPIDRFEREKEHLLPLPRHPYDTAQVGYRMVSQEALVRWEDVPYSVPISSLLDVVVVRATEREVIIYANDLTVLARHERAPRGHHEPVITPAHRPSRSTHQEVEALVARISELGEGAARFASGVLTHQRYRATHLKQVLGQLEFYAADDVVVALERAVRFRAFDGGVVVRILESTATRRQLPTMGEEQVRTRLAEQSAALAVPARSMAEYAQVFASDESRED